MGHNMLFIFILAIALIAGPAFGEAVDMEKARFQADEVLLQADSLYESGNFSPARRNYYIAMNLKDELGDTLGAALSRFGLAKIAFFEGYYSKCLKHLEQVRPVFEAKELYRRLYSLHKMKGEIFTRRGLYDDAVAAFSKAVEQGKKAGEPRLIFRGMESLGKLSLMRNRFEGALNNFGRALSAAPSAPDSGLVYKGIAEVHARQKDYDKALAYFDMAESSAKSDSAALAEVYGALAEVNLNRGDYRGALKCYSAQLDLIKTQQDQMSRARTMMNMAMTYEILKEYAKALDFMEEVVVIFSEMNSPEAVRANEYLKKLKSQ